MERWYYHKYSYKMSLDTYLNMKNWSQLKVCTSLNTFNKQQFCTRFPNIAITKCCVQQKFLLDSRHDTT